MTNSLQGKRVLVTRAKGQNTKLSRQLEVVGAVPVEFPTIQIVSADDTGPLDEAIANLSAYNWLILTSVNGVTHFGQRLSAAGIDATDLQNLKVAVIGPATADAAAELGLSIDLMPSKHVAESLAAAFDDIAGQRILLPTTDIARNTLPNALRAKGALVDRAMAYQTKAISNPGILSYLLPELDILTFTSPSTVQSFVNLLEPDELRLVTQKTIVCIGPVTTQAARKLGLPVHIIPEIYTIPGLVEAMEAYFEF